MAANTPQPGLKPLSTAWTQGLQGQQKADFESMVRNSTTLLKRLREIIEEKTTVINKQTYSVDDFKDPSWGYKQAFRNGELSQLSKFLEIITLG